MLLLARSDYDDLDLRNALARSPTGCLWLLIGSNAIYHTDLYDLGHVALRFVARREDRGFPPELDLFALPEEHICRPFSLRAITSPTGFSVCARMPAGHPLRIHPMTCEVSDSLASVLDLMLDQIITIPAVARFSATAGKLPGAILECGAHGYWHYRDGAIAWYPRLNGEAHRCDRRVALKCTQKHPSP